MEEASSPGGWWQQLTTVWMLKKGATINGRKNVKITCQKRNVNKRLKKRAKKWA